VVEFDLLPNGRLNPDVSPVGRLEVNVENIRSDIKLYDIEMWDRLDIRRYPKIIVDLLAVQEVDPGRFYRVGGEVTFHGVRKKMAGDLTVRQLNNGLVEAVGETRLDVRDFNVTPPKLVGIQVFPEVHVRITLVGEIV